MPLGVVNLLAFVEISLMVSRSEGRQVIGREVDGKYRNFDKFPLLSLMVDTSGESKLPKSKFRFCNDYSVDLKREKLFSTWYS